MKDLTGKVGIVTGGANGIGRAIAERFLAEGMRVVIADVEADTLATTASELEALGDVAGVVTDVTDAAAVQALADEAKARFGTFHVVCNNAGVGGHMGLSWETSEAEWRWVFEVNVWGVINGIKAFVPTLLKQGEGHVVNTSSQMGWEAAPVMAPYLGAKHAVLGISDGLRTELAALGSPVGVSVLCPGPTDTLLLSSGRNWPSALGPEPAAGIDPITTAVRTALADPTGSETGAAPMAAPASAAEAVMDGIRNGTFVVSAHIEAIVSAAERRLADARAGRPRS